MSATEAIFTAKEDWKDVWINDDVTHDTLRKRDDLRSVASL